MVILQPRVGAITVLAALAVVAIVIVRLRRRSRRRDPNDAPIANVSHAQASPTFRRLLRRYHTWVGVELASLSVLGLAATILTMRPATEQRADRDVRNRDVMLCLDVSGSMIDLDAEVLATFAQVAAGLDGERIGLTIFNGSAVSVFPLTDDAEYIAGTLAAAATAIVENKQLFLEGTNEGGSSLIGDGLASCTLRFDRLDDVRPRSIVFATDNMRAGTPIMSVRQAGELAESKDIRVYGVEADHTPGFAADELREVAEGTGGASFRMAEAGTVDAVVAGIDAMEAARLTVPADAVTEDDPAPWIGLCLVGIGATVLAGWRLRR